MFQISKDLGGQDQSDGITQRMYNIRYFLDKKKMNGCKDKSEEGGDLSKCWPVGLTEITSDNVFPGKDWKLCTQLSFDK